MHISGLQLHPREPRARRVGDDVAVAEHGAFGVASGSTGEADGGEHVGLGGADGTGAGCAGGLNVVERDDGEVGVCALGGLVNSSHDTDVLEGAAGDGEGNLQLGGADNNGGEPSVLDDVLHGIVAEGVVQGHSGDGLAVGSLLCEHPLRAVLREKANHAAARHLVQVLHALVGRVRIAPVDKTFANVHCLGVRITIVHEDERASITNAAAGSSVARSQAPAGAAVDIGAVLEVVVQSRKAGGDGIHKPFGSIRVAVRRAAGSGGLEVFGGDGIMDLRGRFGGTHLNRAGDELNRRRRVRVSLFYPC